MINVQSFFLPREKEYFAKSAKYFYDWGVYFLKMWIVLTFFVSNGLYVGVFKRIQNHCRNIKLLLSDSLEYLMQGIGLSKKPHRILVSIQLNNDLILHTLIVSLIALTQIR